MKTTWLLYYNHLDNLQFESEMKIMKKNFVLIPTILLLMWFFLDMIGISFNNTYLVSRSFGEDGVFFIIYLVSLLLYIFKEKIVYFAT